MHILASAPEDADLIIITNLRDYNWWSPVFGNSLLKSFPRKCFTIHDGDRPVPVLRGIYTSVCARAITYGRVKAGTYGLYRAECKNAFIARYAHSQVDKRYFFSFSGRVSHPIRAALFSVRFSREDVHVEESVDFNVFENPDPGLKARRQEGFAEVLAASKFALCPRGASPSSIRLFESMECGVAPVIISDDWMAPDGPDWSSFSIRVKEREVRFLEGILGEREGEWAEMGKRAKLAYESFFSDEQYFNYLIDRLTDIQRTQRMPEPLALFIARCEIRRRRVKAAIRNLLEATLSQHRGRRPLFGRNAS
jgi:hypothetical protein